MSTLRKFFNLFLAFYIIQTQTLQMPQFTNHLHTCKPRGIPQVDHQEEEAQFPFYRNAQASFSLSLQKGFELKILHIEPFNGTTLNRRIYVACLLPQLYAFEIFHAKCGAIWQKQLNPFLLATVAVCLKQRCISLWNFLLPVVIEVNQ